MVATGEELFDIAQSGEASRGRAAAMNRQQTILFIADTSNGFDFLVLPETRKPCSQELLNVFDPERCYSIPSHKSTTVNTKRPVSNSRSGVVCGSALSVCGALDDVLTTFDVPVGCTQPHPVVPQSHGVGQVEPASAVVPMAVLVEPS
jgi:hypothetical protein